ncbi:MAG: hypothetical protein KME30_28180 [Iphinoe sp. HA4291-MV1]|nr:hypothetical protein [Iphinoe sp. HA4291-MV1]
MTNYKLARRILHHKFQLYIFWVACDRLFLDHNINVTGNLFWQTPLTPMKSGFL